MINKTPFSRLTAGFLIFLISSCTTDDFKRPATAKNHLNFDPETLTIKEESSIRKVRGQVLYLPIYSTVPYFEHDKEYDLSAFVAVHNTDLVNTMKITKVLYFDNDGKLVSDYQKNDTIINPLGTINYFVPESDKSGTGANFIVEWMSDSLINEPLIESVMIGLKFNQGVSFLSSGRILRELN